MVCNNCGNEFDGRSNARYCSNKCKQIAFRDRNSVGLSDSSSVIEPFVYRPPLSQNSNAQITNRITNGFLNGATGGFGNTLNDGINRMTNINNHPFSTIAMIAGSFCGGYVGYNMTEKGKRLSGVILGAGAGMFVGQLGYTLYIQLQEYYYQKNQYQEQLQKQEINNSLSDSKVYTSNEVKYMNVNTIKFDGVYGNFIGHNINYGFSILVYGSPGGGKSHFATHLAKYFERMGNVLYVLAEEGITNSVQSRIERYKTENTDYLQTRKEQDVIDKVSNYKFVIIDSINGMINYNNHIDFVRRLKSFKNLYGVVILNQVNKDGAFTGKNEVLHEIDVEISVENGVAETRKNRFDYGGKKFNIFPDSNKVLTKITAFNEYEKLMGN